MAKEKSKDWHRDEAHRLDRFLSATLTRITKDAMDVGKNLFAIHNNGYWEHLGAYDFEDYVDHIGLSMDSAKRYMDVYETFKDADSKLVSAAGTTKLQVIKRVSNDPELANDWLKIAVITPTNELRKMVVAELQARRQSGAPVPTYTGRNQVHTFTFTPDERQLVLQTIEVVKEETEARTQGEALAEMAKFWRARY